MGNKIVSTLFNPLKQIRLIFLRTSKVERPDNQEGIFLCAVVRKLIITKDAIM